MGDQTYVIPNDFITPACSSLFLEGTELIQMIPQ